jgi:hypothetical protein
MNHQESEATRSEDTADALKSKNQKLRALLDGLDLTPEQTKDDISKPSNRDSEILRDVPPHHGN